MEERTTTIHQIVRDYNPSLQILEITRPLNGYSKSVYFLSCRTTSDVEFVFKFTKSDDATEVHFYQLLDRCTTFPFPVPRIFVSDSLIQNYYISSKLPGLPLSQLWNSMTHVQRLDIYRELGSLVGNLHSKYTYERCGYLQAEQFQGWKAMLTSIVEKQVRQFQGTILEKLANKIEKYLMGHMHLLDDNIVPRLLHMDLHAGNILVSEARITGILDAEDALIGHNEYELMRIEKGHFENEAENEAYREEFMSSYQKLVTLDDGYEARRRLYSLSRELVGMQCLIDYGDEYASNGSVEQEKRNIEDKINHIVEA